MTIDVRLWEADEWQRKHRWLEAEIDRLSLESRYCRERERELRDAVRMEREVAAVQDEADRMLSWRPKGKRPAS